MDLTDKSLISIRRILRVTQDYGRKLAAQAGITPVQFRVLQIIHERGETTAKEISEQMRVSAPTMTAVIQRLTAKDLITRSQCASDKRIVLLGLSAAGQQIIDDAPDALQARFVRQFEALEDWEKSMIVASLERVVTLLDAEHLDAAPVLFPDDGLSEAS